MPFISEIHFLNSVSGSTGVAEYVEVALFSGEDPENYVLTTYEFNGDVRAQLKLSNPNVTSAEDPDSGLTIYTFETSLAAPNSLTNNSSEAVSLTDVSVEPFEVISFYDMGGPSVTANGGVASGATSESLSFDTNLQSIQFDGAGNRVDGNLTPNHAIPCYASGTMIMTARGKVAVEDLRCGDRVLTAGQGYQPILWKDHSTINEDALNASPNLRPVRIKPGAFGNDTALFVSQQHCMQIDINGEKYLVRAKHLAEYTQLAHIAKGKTSITYHHILLPRHAIIYANGALSESLYPGPQSLKMLSRDSLVGLFTAIAPQGEKTLVEAYGDRCLPCLTGREVRDMQNSHEFRLAS